MIRKILEQNCNVVERIYTPVNNYIICKLNNSSVGIGKTNDEALEKACRQYVKENGFKRNWLDKDAQVELKVDWVELALKCRNSEYEVNNTIVNDTDYYKDYPNYPKLIAWLYANDIEIII